MAQQAKASPPVVTAPLSLVSAPIPLGKLSNAVKPLAYRLDLTIDPAKERFSGAVEIDAQLATATVEIYLHGRGLAMQTVTAKVGGKSLTGRWSEVDSTGVAVLRFDELLPKGPVTLIFTYDAAFNEGPAGLFRTKVGDDWYSWSQFQSIDGRAAFPSFDEPGFKVPFTVTLRTPPGLTAVSNAPQISKVSEAGLDVHRFAPTLPLPTYLIAAMVGPFVVAESEVPPTPQRAAPLPLRVISTKPNASKLNFALEGSKGIVTKLESYFDQAFPYPKLDQISSPIMPGAMENAGADLYNDSILIMDENASVSRKRRFGMVVAHELAHQWFGDLVTPAWWDDIWLNESFANWMGYRIGAEWRPDLNIAAGARAEGFAAMDTDALLAGRPIRQAIETNAQINSSFDSITYGKGGQVVSMIAAFLGDTKFRDGVRGYMTKHNNGNATSDDFFAALAAAAGDGRVVTALRSFTDQQGVPLLTFTPQGNRIAVTQSRYAPLGVTAPPIRWMVPLCARRGAAKQCQLLSEQSGDLALEGSGALIPNADGAGYYRFELPAAGWDALIAEADRLPSGEAIAVADSLLASFRAGRSSSRRLTDLARRLVNNPDSQASESAGDLLEGLTAADLISPAAMPRFRAYVKRLYQPILRKTGFDLRPGAHAGDEPDLAQRRAIAVGRLVTWGKDGSLRRRLNAAGQSMLTGDKAALDPAWYGLAFDAWLDGGGLPKAKLLADRALGSQDSEFRNAALGALAGSAKVETAEWLLNGMKDQRLRRSEQRGLLGGVLLTKATRDVGYSWLSANLADFTGGNDGIFFTSRVPQMLSGFCTGTSANQIALDFGPRFAGKAGELELARTIERVRNCGRLHDARMEEVSAEIADLR